MKILVTELPERASDCFFSYHNPERGWMCRLSGSVCEVSLSGMDCRNHPCPHLLGTKNRRDENEMR